MKDSRTVFEEKSETRFLQRSTERRPSVYARRS